MALGRGELGFFQSGGLTHIRGNTDGDGAFEVSFTVNTPVNGSDFIL